MENGARIQDDNRWEEFGAERYFSPRIYSTGGDRCPVKDIAGTKTTGHDETRFPTVRFLVLYFIILFHLKKLHTIHLRIHVHTIRGTDITHIHF